MEHESWMQLKSEHQIRRVGDPDPKDQLVASFELKTDKMYA